MEIKKGEFYWTYSGVLFVRGTEYDGYEGRTYFTGPVLNIETMEVEFDKDGYQRPKLSLEGSAPLNDREKGKVITKFAKKRRKGVAVRFFKQK